jgi:hypothetical protein
MMMVLSTTLYAEVTQRETGRMYGLTAMYVMHGHVFCTFYELHTESPLSVVELLEHHTEVVMAYFWPKFVHKKHLRVGHLPEQKVGNPEFP